MAKVHLVTWLCSVIPSGGAYGLKKKGVTMQEEYHGELLKTSVKLNTTK